MDLKSRKLIWFLVGALGIGLILEGAGSAIALARFGPGAHVLTKGDQSVAIAATATPSDQAVRLSEMPVSFGFTETYRLPDGATVRCRYIGPLARCSNGWSAVAS
ncbi:MAG: hypothetical protein AAFY90_14115 [Pseudomonadota bacterium]